MLPPRSILRLNRPSAMQRCVGTMIRQLREKMFLYHQRLRNKHSLVRYPYPRTFGSHPLPLLVFTPIKRPVTSSRGTAITETSPCIGITGIQVKVHEPTLLRAILPEITLFLNSSKGLIQELVQQPRLVQSTRVSGQHFHILQGVAPNNRHRSLFTSKRCVRDEFSRIFMSMPSR